MKESRRSHWLTMGMADQKGPSSVLGGMKTKNTRPVMYLENQISKYWKYLSVSVLNILTTVVFEVDLTKGAFFVQLKW